MLIQILDCQILLIRFYFSGNIFLRSLKSAGLSYFFEWFFGKSKDKD